MAAAIESVELRHDKDDNPIKKIKFHSKLTALDKLEQHKKLWGPKEESTTNQSFYAIFLDGLRSGELQAEMQRRGLLPAPPTPIEGRVEEN